MKNHFATLLLTILLSACAAPHQTGFSKDGYLDKYAKIRVIEPSEFKGREDEVKKALGDEYPQNFYKALRLFDKSGEELPSEYIYQFNVAMSLMSSPTNDRKSLDIALDDFQALAQYGSSWSQYILGGYYLYGSGSTLQDFTLAHMWFNVAASQGHRRAAAVLDVLTKDMSADQIAEAQKLARECVAKNYKGC